MEGSAWGMAIRPRTLFAALVPIIVGTALAFRDSTHSWPAALVALAAAVLIQIGSNLANDLYDFKNGADTPDRLGPTRVMQQGLLTEKQVKRAMIFAFVVAVVLGIFLAWRGGWPIVAIGLASIAAAILYTGGPFPYGYRGLGEFFVILFFGIIGVGGMYYVHTLTITPTAIWCGVPVGLLCANILVVNNIRDLFEDRRSGKMTLVARFGKTFGFWMYDVFLFVSFLIPIFFAATQLMSWLVLLPLAMLPSAFSLRAELRREEGKSLNRTLARTAQFELVFGVLFSIGLILAR